MARKILIVDDNAINRQMLINVLEKDYDILEASDGEEALSLVHRNFRIISAVLLDIIMPEMDGYEVLRQIRENALLSPIPVLMVTASMDEEARVKALSLGANDFIMKPFNPEIVRHCLRNNITLRETASILNAIQKDKLTGLYNREAFFEKVNTMIKGCEPGRYILSCFDIDSFKLINDQYGAAEGDRILKEVGNAVRVDMNRIGGIAARISADNFAALFPVEKKDTDVLQRIQEKSLVLMEQRTIAFSVGRYVISDPHLPASASYDRAYLAKQSVKGRYDKHLAYFDETMLEKLVRDQQIVGGMEKALSERQFCVWFQPQYNHVSGALTGAEALVRWMHPQNGLISPAEFIPLFEQNGFIYELDKYVWRETCHYLRKWLDDGLDPLPVSVNVSRYDIFRADLIETITGIVKEYEIPINLLRLEITESAFAKSTKVIVEIVKQLVELGFLIEIDDFGSGYSSLNTLKSVPAQVIKLDMRFLEDGEDGQRGGNILESVVRMTKWLGMSIIAEGVETKDQGDFLKSIGCSHVQGYLYARPMPAEEYELHFSEAEKERELPILETVENLDNNMFWNPKSMDSLIFNSYVGSACIYEYQNGRIELLRATDKYAQMLSRGTMNVGEVLKLDLGAYLDEKASLKAQSAIKESMATKGEVTGEFVFLDLPGCPHETYIRSTLRVIASIDDRYLVYCISENITAQRISEQKERKVAKQLQVILSNVNCGISAVAVIENELHYLLANDNFYEVQGYTKEQYRKEIDKNYYSVIIPEDRQKVLDIVAQTMETRSPSSMEYRVKRRDGKVIWLRSLLSVTEFEDVEGLVQLCTYADVTAEKNTAQNLLDNLPCGAGICEIADNDARMTYLNKRYLTYFKNRKTERSPSAFEVIHPEDRPLLRDTMIPMLMKKGEGTCVIRVTDGASEYIPFRISGVKVESDSGSNFVYVTFVPISYEELSVSETLSVALEKVMASSPMLSFVKDKNLRYICCSKKFAQMVGLKDEKDVYGKTDYDLFDKELADQYVADDRHLLESGKSIVNLVEKIPEGDGRNRYASTSKYLLQDSRGKLAGLYGTGMDITQVREVESRQQFLINTIPGGVAIYQGIWSNMDSIKLTYFSDGFCKLFGYTREEYEALGKKNPTSLVAREYLSGMAEQIERLVRDGTPIDYVFSAKTREGRSCWIHLKGVPGERQGEEMTVNALLFDVTDHQNALERLRVSEEENRLAIRHSENVVCRYDVSSRSLSISSNANPIFELSPVLEDVPYRSIREGEISPETVDVYIKFYEAIFAGEKNGSVVFQRKSKLGWRWLRANFSTIFSGDGAPISAVMSFSDVTESLEKDVAYKKWIQSLHNKESDSYSLVRCNLSKNAVIDTVEGALVFGSFQPEGATLDGYAAEYATMCVLEEDKECFRRFLNASCMLEKYYLGQRVVTLEYREKTEKEEYRWLRLTADLVEFPHSTNVGAYLLFENIDEEKRAKLQTLERAETDPLTGVLNRVAFEERVDARIRQSEPNAVHALMMLDIDGFKMVNDVFGHGAGDQTLIDLANMLRKTLRRDDFIGRLDGDEFVVFIHDIIDEKIAVSKAKQICQMSRKVFSEDVRISGSVGIAVYPRDGGDFRTLYQRTDEALRHVKDSGKDNCAFYREKKESTELLLSESEAPLSERMGEKKRLMLIVDDSTMHNEMLARMFREEYKIEKAMDGNAALIRLRHFGSAISVVLLDLIMPGMDGFEVLEKMKKSPDLCSIPVIVVSGATERETCLRAIRAGASDFVVKPVDPDILRIRVLSAISKAENERLRAKNSFLELQSAEAIRYQTVLEKIGLAVAEINWGKSTFSYGATLSEFLAGTFDNRSLWHIFLSDLVADAETVKEIQQAVHDLANDRKRIEGNITAVLRTPKKAHHRFQIQLYKMTNEFGLTSEVILTFQDMDAETEH